jgi:hypothetical protein
MAFGLDLSGVAIGGPSLYPTRISSQVLHFGRQQLLFMSVVAQTVLLVAVASVREESVATRPNFLFMLADDWVRRSFDPILGPCSNSKCYF